MSDNTNPKKRNTAKTKPGPTWDRYELDAEWCRINFGQWLKYWFHKHKRWLTTAEKTAAFGAFMHGAICGQRTAQRKARTRTAERAFTMANKKIEMLKARLAAVQAKAREKKTTKPRAKRKAKP